MKKSGPTEAMYTLLFTVLDIAKYVCERIELHPALTIMSREGSGGTGLFVLLQGECANALYDEREQAENYMVRHFPSFFLALNEAERVPFARHAKRMFRYFVIYHKRLGESQRAYEARRRSGNFDYDSDEQEFISGIGEHLTRATDDLHKVTEYLLTKP